MTITHDTPVHPDPQSTADDRLIDSAADPHSEFGGNNTDPPNRTHRHLLGWLLAGLGIAATIALVVVAVTTDRTVSPTEQSFVGDAKDHENFGPVTASAIAEQSLVGDAKDHENFGPVTASAIVEQSLVGDAKDHENFGPVTASAIAEQSLVGDAKDHQNFGSATPEAIEGQSFVGDAKDHPGYGPVD